MFPVIYIINNKKAKMLVLKNLDCDNVSQRPSKGYANWMCGYKSNSNFATCRIGKVYFSVNVYLHYVAWNWTIHII